MNDENVVEEIIKPGYKTTEFWLTTIATIVGVLLASDLLSDGSNLFKAVAFIGSSLAALGYTVSRAIVKK